MTKEEGLKEIDQAQWKLDEYGIQNLYAHTDRGELVHAWLQQRQSYCDRGHIQLIVDGPLDIDEADSFPRYFFSFEEADKHTREFLKWRLWKHRSHAHPTWREDAQRLSQKDAP